MIKHHMWHLLMDYDIYVRSVEEDMCVANR